MKIKKALSIILLSIFIYSGNSHAVRIWMPATVRVNPAGDFELKNPLPRSKKKIQKGPVGNKMKFAGVFPTLGGSFSKFRRIFAEESNSQNQKLVNLTQTSQGEFLPANHQAGYRVLDSRQANLSLGLGAQAGPGGFLAISAQLGISGSFNSKILLNRWAPNLAQAKALDRWAVNIKIPTKYEELTKWRAGDSLSYSKNFSLGINAAIGAGWIAKVGLNGDIKTQWNVSMKWLALNANKPIIRLEYAKDKNGKIGAVLSNPIASLNIDQIWGRNKSFEYEFDFSKMDPNKKYSLKIKKSISGKEETINGTALKAFQLAVGGQLLPADMLADIPNSGITRISEKKKKYSNTILSARVGVPWIIDAKWSRGKNYVTSRTIKYSDDYLLEEQLGIFSRDYTTSGLASSDTQRKDLFTANYQQLTPLGEPDGSSMRRYSASYKYIFQKNGVDVERLREELKWLRYRIGFMKQLKNFRIPLNIKNIGSLKIQADLSLSNAATDELLNIAQKHGEKVLVDEALAYLEGFFKNVKDFKKEICRNPKIRNISECLFTTKRQTKSAMKKIYSSLMDMKKARGDFDYKNFVKAFATFGSGFIENRFTMKTILRMLKYRYNPQILAKIKSGDTSVNYEDKFGAPKMVRDDSTGRMIQMPYQLNVSIESTEFAPYKLQLWPPQ